MARPYAAGRGRAPLTASGAPTGPRLRRVLPLPHRPPHRPPRSAAPGRRGVRLSVVGRRLAGMRGMSEFARCQIVPPYLLRALAASDDPEVAAGAARSLLRDAELRARRQGLPGLAPTPSLPARPGLAPGGPKAPHRVISDAQETEQLPGTLVRDEGDPATGDPAADEAYDGLGHTWELFSAAFGRNSLDGRGMPMLATVHFGRAYDNAFWDGTQMVFGDGDGRYFHRFTLSLDVIGHELTHGVTELTAGLTYRGQSGALNESVSDVFGSLVRQHALGHGAAEADWLIGADLFTDAVQGEALRSLKAPGTAYDDPALGRDPQPAHLRDYVETTDDNGGVHINSGIPNHAFYLAATTLGGNAWEAAGRIWYAALTGPGISADCDFATFARLTVAAAKGGFGAGSREASAVESAWEAVGVLDPGAASVPAGERAPGAEVEEAPEPGAATEVFLRRTGGFAGLTRERSVRLAELPGPDAEVWRALLGGGQLQALADSPTHPDAYCYEVCCRAPRLRVSLPEPALPGEVRDLLERTLSPGD